MKHKNIVPVLAIAALITGAIFITPTSAQGVDEPVEPEWVPPCEYDGDGPWWLNEDAQPPCLDSETGEFTPVNPECDGEGPWWLEEGSEQTRRGNGLGKGGRRGGKSGGLCRGSS